MILKAHCTSEQYYNINCEISLLTKHEYIINENYTFFILFRMFLVSEQTLLQAKNLFAAFRRFFLANMILSVVLKKHIAFPWRAFDLFESNFLLFAILIFAYRNTVLNPIH